MSMNVLDINSYYPNFSKLRGKKMPTYILSRNCRDDLHKYCKLNHREFRSGINKYECKCVCHSKSKNKKKVGTHNQMIGR